MESSGSGRVTFGSYPMSTSYGTQNLGGSSYVVQPDLLQQSLSGYSGYGTQGLSSSLPSSFTSFPGYSGYVGQQTMLPSTGYSFGNFNNLGGSTYGNMGATTFNSLGNYGSYGIPDPITTSGSTGGGGCPYCFGNKGGYKAKRATFSKRIPSQLKKSSSDSKKSFQAKKN
ncbi:unnamed protein product [Nippostrongylus brasiliensis]|uniref:Uncharacterized protein n=1 Tax=Nippostrongylus brasiliensis TaxID=27835 RepID=A0A0N4YIX2_NIPBR|nr:unnamed protein product [Nippostrongylus brasiliensis]